MTSATTIPPYNNMLQQQDSSANLTQSETLAFPDFSLEDLAMHSSNSRQEEEVFALFLRHLDNYVLPVIILIGITGNLTSFTGE